MLNRSLDKLSMKDRPLSKEQGVPVLYEKREPLYRRFSDFAVENEGDIEDVAKKVYEKTKE